MNMDACDGNVQGAVAIAFVNSEFSAAIASRLGEVSRSYPYNEKFGALAVSATRSTILGRIYTSLLLESLKLSTLFILVSGVAFIIIVFANKLGRILASLRSREMPIVF